jgi:hypothetical protein
VAGGVRAGLGVLVRWFARHWPHPPRREWIDSRHAIWIAAQRLVHDGVLTGLKARRADVADAVEEVTPVLKAADAVQDA